MDEAKVITRAVGLNPRDLYSEDQDRVRRDLAALKAIAGADPPA
ncbi:MAG TPA: hypothetical protein VF286_08680 [Acidiphilium sp.]